MLLKKLLLLLLKLIRGRGSRKRFDGAPPVCIGVKRMARTVVLFLLLLLLNITQAAVVRPIAIAVAIAVIGIVIGVEHATVVGE